ncbi:phage tail spike protein [Weissella tructae]|uniref:phage tail spike protein n=1 Tax=Weissella tructae TaxID=887702 RepID=UPI003D8FCCF9
MTPILYPSTAVDYTDNGLGLLHGLSDADVEEQRNGLFKFTATYPTTGERFKDIAVDNIIVAKPNPNGVAHAFRIVFAETDVFGRDVYIEADSITYDLTHNLIKKIKVDGDGQAFMTALEQATIYPHLFKFYSDITNKTKTTLEYVNPMEAMAGVQGSFLQMLGGEMLRENRKVSMLRRRGRDNVTSFRLGKNIKGLKYTVDTSNLVTEIVPTVSVQNGDASKIIEGKFVTSANANNYPIKHTKVVDVSQNVSFNQDATDAEIKKKIDEWSKDWFTKSQNTGKDKPTVSVDIDVLSLQDSADYQDKFKDLETVQLTDTVTVYVPEFNINVLASVNEFHYDPLREQVTKLVVGAAKVSFASANKNQLNELQNTITQIREDATNAVRSADGKSTVYSGRFPPAHPQNDDLWIWNDGTNEGIKRWVNGQWVDVVDTKTQERISEDIDKALESAKDHADNLDKKTNDDFSKTVAKIDEEISGIQPKIDEAKEAVLGDAKKAIGAVEVKVDSITSVVNDPETGISATRVQLNNTVQQEIKDRKSGDMNTLTQAKDFTSSQIKSSETGMKSFVAQTSDSLIATINSMNWIVDSSLVNMHKHWIAINQSGVATVGKGFYYSSAVRYKGVPSTGINTVEQGNTYKFISSQDIARSSMPSATIYVSVDVLAKKIGGTSTDYLSVYVHELDANKKPIKGGNSVTGTIGAEKNVGVNGKWTNYRKTITLDEKTKYVRLTYQMRGNGNVYVARPYIGADQLPNNAYVAGPSDTTSTVLELFKDNFALGIRENTGELIAGISADKSGVRIPGEKITLDGNVNATGDFYAQGGKFKNLNASNMTTGTFNAALANLINVNANSITTGMLRGPNLSINLTSGVVTFQKGRLYSTTKSIDMNIDQGYLSVANSKNNVLIRNGEIAFTQPTLLSPDKDPYLRITNDVISSSFASATVKAKYGIEFNIKGNEASIVDMGVQSLAGIKFGKGNSGKLERTLIGGGNQGVKISGGTITTGMLGASPNIVIGQNKDQNGAGNRVFIHAEYLHAFAVHNKTSSKGANVFVSSDGALVRSTSARKYKTRIENNVPISDSQKLLKIPLSTWDDKAELKNTGKSERYFGMIAEDLADAGLDYLVTRDETGQIEGIEYSRVALLLIPLVKQLQEDINNLKQTQENTNE